MHVGAFTDVDFIFVFNQPTENLEEGGNIE
jgi:hypothetical protein